MSEEVSEFGKGLVICLFKFAEHIMHGYNEYLHGYMLKFKREFYKEHPEYVDDGVTVEEKAMSETIKSFMNAASDHLYDIEVPKGKSWDKIREKVEKLKNIGLEMGHGFNDEIYTKDDLNKLFDLAREICLDIDKKIGLEPDIGMW